MNNYPAYPYYFGPCESCNQQKEIRKLADSTPEKVIYRCDDCSEELRIREQKVDAKEALQILEENSKQSKRYSKKAIEKATEFIEGKI